jgi:hypothetical protein
MASRSGEEEEEEPKIKAESEKDTDTMADKIKAAAKALKKKQKTLLKKFKNTISRGQAKEVKRQILGLTEKSHDYN